MSRSGESYISILFSLWCVEGLVWVAVFSRNTNIFRDLSASGWDLMRGIYIQNILVENQLNILMKNLQHFRMTCRCVLPLRLQLTQLPAKKRPLGSLQPKRRTIFENWTNLRREMTGYLSIQRLQYLKNRFVRDWP